MLIEDVKKFEPLQRFIYWINERENIRQKKETNQPRPWTNDTILQTYRFCNVVRMDDRVSKWLLDRWYTPYRDHPDMLQAVAIARFFNTPVSLHPITSAVFDNLKLRGVDYAEITTILRGMKAKGVSIFNGAYMVRGNDGIDKVECVLKYYVKPLEKLMITRDSMFKTWSTLINSYGIGSFMAGQIVADLRWAVEGTWKDRYRWAPVGPGSARGLSRITENTAKKDKQYVSNPNLFTTTLVSSIIPEVSGRIPIELMQRMEAHDYQNCLCEFDKYERALWGDGKPKQLYKPRK